MNTTVIVNGFTHVVDNKNPQYKEPYICVVNDSMGIKLISGIRLDSDPKADYSKCLRIIESSNESLVKECGLKFISV